jgi:hypothetical protein
LHVAFAALRLRYRTRTATHAVPSSWAYRSSDQPRSSTNRFKRLGSAFSNCTSFQNEVIAAGASGDLAYIVAFEHTTASIGGAAPEAYLLRATTVFRREEGEWKVVHRHADPASSDTKDALAERLGLTTVR